MRHTAYAELYGLTPAQRQDGAIQAAAALDSEQVSEVTERQIIQDYPGKLGTALLVNCAFASEASGQRVFNALYRWAKPNATGGNVRAVTVDDSAGTITTWISAAPGWPAAQPVVRSLFSLPPG